ncbi:hypothetical protein [Streptomyces sp. NPDC006285]|uniref:hypothetical protein n=1 Tax=Streptomyces sp. NPDC006285 TaxID=3364742 RepID=UPI003698A1A3
MDSTDSSSSTPRYGSAGQAGPTLPVTPAARTVHSGRTRWRTRRDGRSAPPPTNGPA